MWPKAYFGPAALPSLVHLRGGQDAGYRAPALSLLSGLLQAAGYFLYFRGSLRHEILPNATTWLMFAWDTTLLVVLHASLGASPMILLLPTVCASCSIAVAAVSWAKRGFRWPDDDVDRFALTSCAVLTIGYATSSSWRHRA